LYCASRDVFTNTVTESACGDTVTSLSSAGSVWAQLGVGTSSVSARLTTTSTMGIRFSAFI